MSNKLIQLKGTDMNPNITPPQSRDSNESFMLVSSLISLAGSDLQLLIDTAAALPKAERDAFVCSAIEAKMALVPAEANTAIITAQGEIDEITVQLARQQQVVDATPPTLTVDDPGIRFPKGFNLAIFLGCIFAALVVTAADVWNSMWMVLQYLQSYKAALAFLIPAAAAPIAAKLGIMQLSSRFRSNVELFLGLCAIPAAAFFIQQLVFVFSTSQTIDQIAAGLTTDRRWCQLAMLSLGFVGCYLFISKAFSLVLSGPRQVENPAYKAEKEKLAPLQAKLAAAKVQLNMQKPRLDKVTAYKDYLYNFIMAAAQSRQNLLQAREAAEEARIKSHFEASLLDWQKYENAIGASRRNGHPTLEN
jgi:hypothetical protein